MTAGRLRPRVLLALSGAVLGLAAPAGAAAATAGPTGVTAAQGPLSLIVAGYDTYLPNDALGWVVVADTVPLEDGEEGEELTAAAGCETGPGGDEVICDVEQLPVYTVRGSTAGDGIAVAFEPCEDPADDCPAPPPRVEIRTLAGDDVIRTSNGGRIEAGDGADTIDIAAIAFTPLTVDAGAGDDVIVDERADPEESHVPVTITCGPGDDTVRFLQPEDTAAADCEHVHADAGPPPTPPPVDPGVPPGTVPDPPAQECTVLGTDGDDRLVGTEGDDVVCGLGGDDELTGLGGSDVLAGGDGRDVLLGGDGSDRLTGGAGADSLAAGAGDDLADGGDGDDVLRGEDGADDLRGGAGSDLVTFLESPRSMTVDLRAGRASGDGQDTLQGLERARGSLFPDRLLGSAAADVIDGAGGGDLIAGGGGRDRLSGGAGDDRLAGGAGRDVLVGGAGVNALDGGGGTDVCFSSHGGRRRGCEVPAAR